MRGGFVYLYGKKIDVMIPYENYQLSPNQIEYVKHVNARNAIEKYVKLHGAEPSDLGNYYTVNEKQLESYKRAFYSLYFAKEVANEDPSKLVDVPMEFSTVDEQTLFGASTFTDTDNYQYEYWRIAILIYNENSYGTWLSEKVSSYAIGTFSSLKNVTIKLNTCKKYAICVHYRRSKRQISLTIDNTFHNFTQYPSNTPIAIDEPQLGDKEYIGVIEEYIPHLNGTIKGVLYTLNPQLMVSVSGLTRGMSIDLKYDFGEAITVTCDENGSLTTNGDMSKLVDNLDSSFSYILTKDKLIGSIVVTDVLNIMNREQNDIQNPQCKIYDRMSRYAVGHTENGSTITIEGGNHCLLLRNSMSYESITIPTQTDIDTGFEFDTVDD